MKENYFVAKKFQNTIENKCARARKSTALFQVQFWQRFIAESYTHHTPTLSGPFTPQN